MSPLSNMFRLKLLLLSLSFCISLQAQEQRGDDANKWIWKMSKAMEQLTYEGTFVYLHGGEVETLQVIHDSTVHGERERLSSLNGEARIIIRDAENVTCIWPGSKSVIISESKPRIPFPSFKSDNFSKYARYYKFTLMEDDRVAGLQTTVVDVRPIDSFRYGFKLWIDKNSHLLLRSMLTDSNENVIEQILFTSIDFPKTTKSDNYMAQLENEEGYTWHRVKDNAPKVIAGDKDYIKFSRLPEGFVRISESLQPLPMSKNPVRHLVFSDGMASVSVYIEFSNTQKSSALNGWSSMGAINAYGRTLSNAFVTVVGEVPKETVKLIGDSIIIPR